MIDLFRPKVNRCAGWFVQEVLSYDKDGRMFIGEGPISAKFEKEFGELVGGNPLVVSSGTAAIDLALHLIGVEPGDEVISTPMTCTATNNSILLKGAIPVWADVDPYTGLIDPKDVVGKITRKTRAIVAVDWGGKLCDYDSLCSYGIPVVQDAAHALLATRSGRHFGDYTCWSFQAIKHLTTGDGGAIRVPAHQYDRAKLLRWYGLDRTKGESFRCSQDIVEAGYKYHMNDIAASIGLANLPSVRGVVETHRSNAKYYDEALMGLTFVRRPEYDEGSSWWLYTLLIGESKLDRDHFISMLDARGIASSQVHRRNDEYTAFREVCNDEISLPGVDYFSSRQVSIPVGWWLTHQDREKIVQVVKEWSQY
jgi:perosamine synthetase